jgi:hypothetical protein
MFALLALTPQTAGTEHGTEWWTIFINKCD